MATEDIDVRLQLRDELSKPLKRTEEQTRSTSEETEGLGEEFDKLDPKARAAAASLKRLENQEKRLALQSAELEARQARVAKAQEKANKEAEEAAEKLRKQSTAMGRLSEKLRGGKANLDQFNHGLSKAIFGLIAFRRVITALKIAGFITAITTAGGAIAALGAAAAGAVGGLSPMVGMLGAIPAVGVGAGLALGTIRTGLHGISDAIETLSDPSATIKEINEATRDLGPAAKMYAVQIANIKAAWQPVQRSVQQAMLPLVGGALERVVYTYLPMLQTELTAMGGLFGTLADRASKAVTTGPWQRDITFLLRENRYLTEQWATIFGRFGPIVRDIAVSAAPMLRNLAKWFDTISLNMMNWFAGARKSGKLTAFFDKALRVTQRLSSFLWDLTVGLTNLGGVGAKALGPIWRDLEKVAAQFRAWTETEEGRKRIAEFFERMRPVIRAVGSLALALGGALITIAETPGIAGLIGQLETELLPAIVELMQVVGTEMGPSLITGATALVGLATALASGGLIDNLIGVVDMLTRFVNWLNKMPGPVQSAVVGLLAFTALLKVSGLIPFLTFIGRLAFWFGKTAIGAKILTVVGRGLSLAIKGIGIAMRFLAMNPIGLLIVAIVAIVAIIWHLWKTNDKFRAFVIKTWGKIQDAFAAVWDWLKDNWDLVLAILTGPIGLAVRFIIKNWDKIVAMFKAAPGKIADIASGLWDGLTGAFKAAINTIIKLWNGLELTIDIPDKIPGLPDEWKIGTPNFPLLRYAGGPVWPGQDFLVGELGPELLKTASGLQLIGAHGPELIRPAQSGQVIPTNEVPAYVPQVAARAPEAAKEARSADAWEATPAPPIHIEVGQVMTEMDFEAVALRAFRKWDRERRERR